MPTKLLKGSQEAKEHMAKLRAMRGKSKKLEGKGGCVSRPNRRVYVADNERPAQAREANGVERRFLEFIGDADPIQVAWPASTPTPRSTRRVPPTPRAEQV